MLLLPEFLSELDDLTQCSPISRV